MLTNSSITPLCDRDHHRRVPKYFRTPTVM